MLPFIWVIAFFTLLVLTADYAYKRFKYLVSRYICGVLIAVSWTGLACCINMLLGIGVGYLACLIMVCCVVVRTLRALKNIIFKRGHNRPLYH